MSSFRPGLGFGEQSWHRSPKHRWLPRDLFETHFAQGQAQAAAYVEEQQKLQALQAQQQAAQQGGKYEPRPTSQYTASHPTTQGYAAAKE